MFFIIFFFQAEDGIRDLVRSRGLGDVYKRQTRNLRARVERGGRTGRMFGRQHGGAGVVVRQVEDLSLIHI